MHFHSVAENLGNQPWLECGFTISSNSQNMNQDAYVLWNIWKNVCNIPLTLEYNVQKKFFSDSWHYDSWAYLMRVYPTKKCFRTKIHALLMTILFYRWYFGLGAGRSSGSREEIIPNEYFRRDVKIRRTHQNNNK